jgi:hypothetical protein
VAGPSSVSELRAPRLALSRVAGTLSPAARRSRSGCVSREIRRSQIHPSHPQGGDTGSTPVGSHYEDGFEPVTSAPRPADRGLPTGTALTVARSEPSNGSYQSVAIQEKRLVRRPATMRAPRDSSPPDRSADAAWCRRHSRPTEGSDRRVEVRTGRAGRTRSGSRPATGPAS